ncbi:MAG TPA: sigma-70 family RNA polymerase sigma factor [Actinomycetota bacterium]|nr:sigma-70 family RNA polymerase sigma factor [Actinomycetota bacterium]
MIFIAGHAALSLDDEALAQHAGAEAAAFAELYDRYLEPVHRYVRSKVPDHATAEDLTAQIFFKSFVYASSYRGDGSYRAWIFQIARNTLATWRATTSRLEVPVDEIPEDIPNEKGDLLDLAVGKENEVLEETVARLPAAQREVVRLHYWKGLSIAEIAASTRRSSGAVRQLLHRARRRLKKKLSGKEVGAIAGATGASALTFYSIKRHRENKR